MAIQCHIQNVQELNLWGLLWPFVHLFDVCAFLLSSKIWISFEIGFHCTVQVLLLLMINSCVPGCLFLLVIGRVEGIL